MNLSFLHQVLTESEITALTPAVLKNSPRWPFRFLWGTTLFCLLFALYRGGYATAISVLIVAGFYGICARRLFWPGKKLLAEDCRKILSSRPHFAVPHTVTLTADHLAVDSPDYTFSMDYRLLAHFERVPNGEDELLCFPDGNNTVLRKSEFPQPGDYDAFLAKLAAIGKQNQETPFPKTPWAEKRYALVQKMSCLQAIPLAGSLGAVNAFFCAILLWLGAKLPFFPVLGVAFLWSFAGVYLLLVIRALQKIREAGAMLPAERHVYFDQEHGMLENRTDRNSSRIAISQLTDFQQKGDWLQLKIGVLPALLCFKEDFPSPENWTEFLQTLRDKTACTLNPPEGGAK